MRLLRAKSGTRTRDPRITNALLYQLSHPGDVFSEIECKDNAFFPFCCTISIFVFNFAVKFGLPTPSPKTDDEERKRMKC